MTQRRHPPTHPRIIAAMTENYASKRERWQRLLDALPESLRGHISLRNVEAVSALSPQAQGTLAQAIQAGLKRLPRAIELLDKAPDLTVPELLEKVSAGQEPVETAAVRRYISSFGRPDPVLLPRYAACVGGSPGPIRGTIRCFANRIGA
jgi:hypothetical protein